MFNKMVCTNSTCLKGGICIDGIACTCPPGWQNDYVGYYHSQDCSLPSEFLPVFFVVCTVVTVICIGILHHIARKARKLVWEWKIFYISWLVVDWMAVLAVYAEGGFFAAACILTAIYSWVGTVVPTFIMIKILRSYFRLVPSFPVTIFTGAIAALVIGWNVLTTGILIGAAVVSRNAESESLYNQLIIAWFLTQGGMNVIFLTVFLVFMNKLKRQIDSVMSAVQDQQQGNSRGLGAKHAVKRLGGITHSILGILPISCVNIIIGIMLLVSNSVPYLWILWMFWMTGPIQNLPNALPMFREFSNMKTDSSSKASNSKHQDSRIRSGPCDTLASSPIAAHKVSVVSTSEVPGI